jgi:hypothetical protein
VRVETKFLPNKDGDNICFVLMDKKVPDTLDKLVKLKYLFITTLLCTSGVLVRCYGPNLFLQYINAIHINFTCPQNTSKTRYNIPH